MAASVIFFTSSGVVYHLSSLNISVIILEPLAAILAAWLKDGGHQ
jgi:hypothetical protein